MVVIRFVLLVMVALVSACANQAPPPPAPISAEQFASYRLANVTIDANIIWPEAERDFAASKGLKQTSKSTPFGGRDAEEQTSDEDRAAFAAYDDAIKSEEALAYYRQRVVGVMTPHLTQALSPAFTGETPLDVTVDLTGFVIRSSAAVAFGGDEGVAGPVAFTETNGGKPVATSPNIGFVSKNDTVVPSAGGLAGLAVSLVVSAAINVASDAAVDSADHLSTNYAQSARKWLQLEPYAFPE